ncbi:MAG: substrate-binding domain-containing protein [Enterocloster clostridioformis]
MTAWPRSPREHGLDCRPGHMLFDVNPEDHGDCSRPDPAAAPKPDRPEAIFACNDMTAFNICRACYILGLRIPDHLSVFGYDDCIMASPCDAAPVNSQRPVRKLAGTAIDFIHGYLESGVRAELPILKASLIIRNSVRNLNLD